MTLTYRAPVDERPARKLTPIADFMATHGLSRAKTYGLLRAGDLRAVKCGGRTYVTPEEEARFVQSLPPYRPAKA